MKWIGMRKIQVNDDLKVTLLPAVHWSKRSLTDMNKTLWGNFLIEYKGKKSYLLAILAMEIFTKN
jgi:L-ascorbate metabolism protein UlaG (beta-lactamase superfamily)